MSVEAYYSDSFLNMLLKNGFKSDDLTGMSFLLERYYNLIYSGDNFFLDYLNKMLLCVYIAGGSPEGFKCGL